ncbi:MAG: rhodanese-like domain-containing protein [Myxococcaceae bacterium]
MANSVQELVSQAKAQIQLYSAEEAKKVSARNDVVFVDVRDEPELRATGKVRGAVHASRGMLEFCIDPKSPYHNPLFSSGKEFVFYCKSGGRSALAAQRAREMGLSQVASLEGGFPAWELAGGPVEKL